MSPSPLSDPTKANKLANIFLAMGDDELLLGHRDSEWCGHAPILEEDIAFANLALDEIGHAVQWYGLYGGLVDKNTEQNIDDIVFIRPWQDWRNIQMVEEPRGDWAFSILRQYLFDSAEVIRLEALSLSTYEPLAGIAAKIRKEELYHLRHSSAWVQRLGLGTAESHARMQSALLTLWPLADQIWMAMPTEDQLIEAGWLPDSSRLKSTWLDQTLAFLQECELNPPHLPELKWSRQQHGPHLQVLLAEMQSVYQLDPQAQW